MSRQPDPELDPVVEMLVAEATREIASAVAERGDPVGRDGLRGVAHRVLGNLLLPRLAASVAKRFRLPERDVLAFLQDEYRAFGERQRGVEL